MSHIWLLLRNTQHLSSFKFRNHCSVCSSLAVMMTKLSVLNQEYIMLVLTDFCEYTLVS